MKRLFFPLFALLCFWTLPQAAAQLTTAQILQENHIPPLDVMIDSAVVRSPMRGYHNQMRAQAESMVKSSRRQWSEYVGVESYYRYGRLGVIDVNSPQTSGGSTPLPITTSTTQSQNWWYVGAFLRFPLFAIIDRGNEIKRLKHTVTQSDYLMQDAADNIGMLVIEEYNKMLLNLDILVIKSVLLQTNNAQVNEAENEYKEGKINLGRLAQLQEMQSKVATEYATARSESRTSLLKLEKLTGIALRLDPKY